MLGLECDRASSSHVVKWWNVSRLERRWVWVWASGSGRATPGLAAAALLGWHSLESAAHVPRNVVDEQCSCGTAVVAAGD